MGIGVTRIEVELAEQICELVPSVERVLLTETGSEATFHALRVARAATGRRHVIKFQGCYHGWHDSVAMNVISLPENVGKKDPLSKGILPEVLDATIVCRFNDADEVERALDRPRRRGDHPRADPAQHRRRAAAAGLPRAAARARHEARRRADLRRGDHRLPPRARRLPVDRRRHARPDDDGQGDGQRLARLGARRQGRADGALLDDARPARVLRRHLQRPPADGAAALATIDKLQREPVHEHVFALGERTRQGLRELYARLGVPVVVSGFGSVFVTYFLDGPVTSYDDLLANDVDLFTGYRRELMKHGDLRAAAEPEAQPLLVRAHRRRRRPAARGDRGSGHDRARAPDERPSDRVHDRPRAPPAARSGGSRSRSRRTPAAGRTSSSRSRRCRAATGRRRSCWAATTATSTRARSPGSSCCASCGPSR